MFRENNKELMGKILFIISIFVFFVMFYSPLINLIFHVDEYFTLGLIKLPFIQAITITANDVYPPLYYILLKVLVKIIPGFDIVFISKIFSLIPYLLILILSATKIRNDYDWLTAGLFALTLALMSEFLIFYLTIRMYSWAILFMLLSFVYLRDVISNSDMKSWFLFSLFTLLGAYTHYFVAISSFIIYLVLLVYFVIKKNTEIKKWIISVICLGIGYSPWLLVLFNQLHQVHNNFWISQINLDYLIQCFTYYFSLNTSSAAILIGIIFLIFSFIIFVLEFEKRENEENMYILLGLLLVILTILTGAILSLLFKPILIVRYLLPMVGFFWFSVSILIGRLNNNRLLAVSLALILILCLFNVYTFTSTFNSLYEKGISNQNLLDEINNNNSMVICIGAGEILQFGTYLNDSNVYMDRHEIYGVSDKSFKNLFDIKYSSNLNEITDKNDGSNIYIIMGNWDESDLVNEKDLIYNIDNNNFYKYSQFK